MNLGVPITKNIYWVGANDRKTQLFEGLWPLSTGISYNAYLINDQKTALIDTVESSFFETLIKKINSIIENKEIDYLIVNHMEPDHSGSMRLLLNLYPNIQIIGNKKTAQFIENFYGIKKNIKIIEDGETLELGETKLKFHIIPMLHWPETMMTHETGSNTLFSGDAFGGFGSLNSSIFDDELNLDEVEQEMLRYYSNIVGKYSNIVQMAIEKLKKLEIKNIAPTHGPVWRSDPQRVINNYKIWSGFETKEDILIVYASMYGNTQRMMEEILTGITSEGIKDIKVCDVSKTHISYLLKEAWNHKTIIMGSPTYDTKLFPLMENFIRIIEHKGLKNRVGAAFGTKSWSGGGVDSLVDFIKRSGWKLLEPVIEAKSSPTAEDLQKCIELGKKIASSL